MPTLIDREVRPEDRFIAAFETDEGPSLNGTQAGIRRIRREAMECFAALGFPARKAEAWKYTNIGKILKRAYALLLNPPAPALTPDDIAPFLIPGLDAHVVVLIDGRFSGALSRLGEVPRGVVVTGFAHACTAHADVFDAHFARYADFRDEALTALNTAFTRDGVFVYVPKNTVVEKPVHLISLITVDESVLLQPRNLFVVEQSGALTLIQTRATLTDAPTLENIVTEVFVGANAHVDLYEIQDEGPRASQVLTQHAYQEDDSVFRTSTFTLSGEMIRNNVNILPDGENCESHLYGLFLGSGTAHIDNHTIVDHAKPNCYSNELYKGVLDDQATGVFNGRVLVRQDAQQTNAYQSNKSISLSADARMYSKPELEIYADDVRCSHGATTGQLDTDALFYLRTRGLTEQQARTLMLVAFARDVLENVRVEPFREMVDALVTDRFSR